MAPTRSEAPLTFVVLFLLLLLLLSLLLLPPRHTSVSGSGLSSYETDCTSSFVNVTLEITNPNTTATISDSVLLYSITCIGDPRAPPTVFADLPADLPPTTRRLVVNHYNLGEVYPINLTPTLTPFSFLELLVIINSEVDRIDPAVFLPNITGTHLAVIQLSGNYLDDVPFPASASAPGFVQLPPKLQHLYLDDNHIEEVPAFANCERLFHVDLGDNFISALPPNMFTACPVLDSVNLYDNSLTVVAQPQLVFPPTLRILQLDVNELTTLGAFPAPCNLVVLIIDNNELSTLAPSAFAACSALDTLSFSFNAFTELPPADALPPLLANLWLDSNQLSSLPHAPTIPCTLDHLFLNNNQLTSLEPGALAACHNLTLLSLSNNRLTSFDFAHVPPSLRSLNLSSNNIVQLIARPDPTPCVLESVQLTDTKITTLPPVFRNCSRLTTLDLVDTPLSTIMPYALQNTLLSSFLSTTPTAVTPAPTRAPTAAPTITFLSTVPPQSTQPPSGPPPSPLTILSYALADSPNLAIVGSELHPVTVLGAGALFNCSSLRIITFHTTVSEIHAQALEGTALTRIDLRSRSLAHLGVRAFARNPALLSVLLSRNTALTSLPPELFAGCTALHTVDLSNTAITSIPPSTFADLPSLRTLVLSHTRITSLASTAFSSNLPSLRSLDLSFSSISSIAPGVFDGARRLQTVALMSNPLQDIPAHLFDSFRELASLNLNFMGALTTIGDRAIAATNISKLELFPPPFTSTPPLRLGREALADNPNLSIVGNSLRGISQFGERALANCSQLATLYFGSSSLISMFLDGPAVQAIGAYAFSNTALTTIPLSNRDLDASVSIAPHAFSNMPLLKSIDLSRNALVALPAPLAADCPHLTTATFLSNQLTIWPSNLFNNTPALGSLNFASNQLTSVPATPLPYPLLTEVLLTNNRLQRIPDALANLPRLTTLRMAYNQLTIVHSSALSNLSSLAFLALNHNAITALEPGWCRLGATSLCPLVALDLFNNNIRQLRPGQLPQPSTLVSIYLYANNITELLANTFSSPSLRQLYLHSNNQLTRVESAWCAHCPRLNRLDLHATALTVLGANITASLPVLDFLDLSASRLSQITGLDCSTSPSLKTLYVDDNDLGSISPHAFANCTALTHIYARNNAFTAIPAHIFSDLPSLAFWSLDNNRITSLAPDQFRDVPPSFLSLTLQNNRITRVARTALTTQPLIANWSFLLMGGNPSSCELTGSTKPHGLSCSCAPDYASGAPEAPPGSSLTTPNAFCEPTPFCPSTVTFRAKFGTSQHIHVTPCADRFRNSLCVANLTILVAMSCDGGAWVERPVACDVCLCNETSRSVICDPLGPIARNTLPGVDEASGKLTAFPVLLPAWTETLTLRDEAIPSIPENAFSTLASLRHLTLEMLPIAGELSATTFAPLTSLVTLAMGRVPVVRFQPGTLAPFAQTLEVLDLASMSGLKDFAIDEVASFPRLRTLNLTLALAANVAVRGFVPPSTPIPFPALESLGLGFLEIVSFPSWLNVLPRLRVLEIARSSFESFGPGDLDGLADTLEVLRADPMPALTEFSVAVLAPFRSLAQLDFSSPVATCNLTAIGLPACACTVQPVVPLFPPSSAICTPRCRLESLPPYVNATQCADNERGSSCLIFCVHNTSRAAVATCDTVLSSTQPEWLGTEVFQQSPCPAEPQSPPNTGPGAASASSSSGSPALVAVAVVLIVVAAAIVLVMVLRRRNSNRLGTAADGTLPHHGGFDLGLVGMGAAAGGPGRHTATSVPEVPPTQLRLSEKVLAQGRFGPLFRCRLAGGAGAGFANATQPPGMFTNPIHNRQQHQQQQQQQHHQRVAWGEDGTGTETDGLVARLCTSRELADVAAFLREAKLLVCLPRHPNIVPLLGVVSRSRPMVILTPYMTGGDLRRFLRASRMGQGSQQPGAGQGLNLADLLGVAISVASACVFLSSKRIRHHNIKCKSVLVGAKPTDIRLGGFELARLDDEGQGEGEDPAATEEEAKLRAAAAAHFSAPAALPAPSALQTHVAESSVDAAGAAARIAGKERQQAFRWWAPEVLPGGQAAQLRLRGAAAEAADVWAFGVFVWEVMGLGQIPFGSMRLEEVQRELTEHGFRLQRPIMCPPNLYALLQGCWQLAPGRRPSFAQVHATLVRLTQPEAFRQSRGALGTVRLTSCEIPRSRLHFVCQLEKTIFGSIAKYEATDLVADADVLGALPEEEQGGVGNGGGRTSTARQLVMAYELAAEADAVAERRFLRELCVLQTLRHDNILAVVGVCLASRPVMAVMEWPGLGTLASVVSSQTLSRSQLVCMALDVARALHYLSARLIVHRELSCARCFVDVDLRVKLSGLGFQRVSADTQYYKTTAAAALRIRTVSPESLTELKFSPAGDVYSFGALVFQLYSKMQVPYAALSDEQILACMRQKTPLPALGASLAADVPAPIRALVDACCCRLPAERLPIAEVVQRLEDLHLGEDRWEYPREQLVFVRDLGQGQFGVVQQMLARGIVRRGVASNVAVKSLSAEAAAASTEAERDFLREMELMKRFRHPNLVRLLRTCTRQAPFLMVLEFVSGGALDTHLQRLGRQGGGPTCDLIYILHQIAQGMVALHAAGIVHRDLAARNVLIGGDSIHEVKIADYGLSRRVNDRDYYRLRSGGQLPVRWMAHETLVLHRHTPASDVYAYGVVVFECFSYGQLPFAELDTDEVVRQIGSGRRLPLNLPARTPDYMRSLAMRCTSPAAQQRPSFLELVGATGPETWADRTDVMDGNDGGGARVAGGDGEAEV